MCCLRNSEWPDGKASVQIRAALSHVTDPRAADAANRRSSDDDAAYYSCEVGGDDMAASLDSVSVSAAWCRAGADRGRAVHIERPEVLATPAGRGRPQHGDLPATGADGPD